jgi:FAD/FMN-containing dehydrogenase
MDKIDSHDPRYADLAGKRFNKRYTGRPEYVRLPTSTKDVVDALQEAVNSNLRIVVRSGGHCLEGFVSDPAVQVLVDMSLMTAVDYDADKSAFMVEAGTTVGEMYRRLYLGWAVVLPAGEHPGIGVGGHVVGGAFGFLCREYGLAADYLYAIELVTVNGSGAVHSVIATREANDPNRELWWAHTGGVPVPNEQADGCMINHPDTELADPALNRSGVPWHYLYYKDNYARLQKVKTAYDPLNIFHHALSIQPAGH